MEVSRSAITPAARRARRRAARGALDFDSTEVDFRLAPTGEVVSLGGRERNDAHGVEHPGHPEAPIPERIRYALIIASTASLALFDGPGSARSSSDVSISCCFRNRSRVITVNFDPAGFLSGGVFIFVILPSFTFMRFAK